MQFIYYDLNIKYCDIIRDFDNELQRRISKLSLNVIVMTERTVLKLSRFDWILKTNIHFIELIILIYLYFVGHFVLQFLSEIQLCPEDWVT